MASQYDLPKRSRSGDPRGKEAKIREAAIRNGIDPEIALKVARSEGLSEFYGDNGKSGGAFQLYTGGGLGNKFKKETGLDPLDPKNEDATIDFAMKEAKQSGWKPWYGAAKVGVGQWDGISGGAATKTADVPPAPEAYGYASQAPTPTSTASVDTTPPPGTGPDSPTVAQAQAPLSFTDKLKQAAGDPGTAAEQAIQGLGKAFAGTGASTAVAQPQPPIPVLTTPQPQVVPIVNPQVADAKRQQLAQAMQRLNSGRLY